MLKIVSKLSRLQHGYMCTYWGHVTWSFLLNNKGSNHSDVTTRFVALNSSHEFDQNREKLIKMFWLDDTLKI